MYNKFLENIEKLDQIIADYENGLIECKTLKEEITKTKKLGDALFNKYGRKFVSINEAEIRKYSNEEITAIKAELLDNSFLTIIKRLLGIGKKQEEIYAELMGKIKGLSKYLQNELENKEKSVENCADTMRLLSANIKKSYDTVLNQVGNQESSDWSSYVSEKFEKQYAYFGDTDVFLESEKTISEDIIKSELKEFYHDEFVTVPYVKDAMNPMIVYCEYDGETSRIEANGLVRSLIYQYIRQMQEYTVEMHLFDGENTGNDFSELLGLEQICEDEVWQLNTKVTKSFYKYARHYLSNQDISQGLRNLDQYLGNVASEIAGFSSVYEYNNSSVSKEKGFIPLQLVVIQNFPSGFNDTDIELLRKLIKNGEQRGVSVILQYDCKDKEMFKQKVDNPTQNIMDGILFGNEKVHIITREGSSPIQPQLMHDGKRDYIQSMIDEKTKIREIDNRFSSLIQWEGNIGKRDATNGIYVPFAVDKKGNIREFVLAQALNAHGLISGGTGSGKTSFIHMIISSLCMNYSPKDVELWIIDYKISEFNTYKYNTPPHITFLGLSKGIDFTYALVDKIYTEMENRQRLITKADAQMKQQGENVNITSISDYRKYFGKESMSRLLIIIDEFHVMAQQVNEDYQYKEKLENILAEGRALGITVLFSDQAITVGLKGLTEKGKKQIKCRMALANDEEEMKAMLQTTDRTVVEPFMTMATGDCALVTIESVRDDNGHLVDRQKIERVRNIYIDGETRFALCKDIRKYYNAENYVPAYMDESEAVLYNNEAIDIWNQKNSIMQDNARIINLYLGESLNLSGCMVVPLLRRRGENIMCVGGIEEEQYRIILAHIKSFQRVLSHKIVIIADSNCSIFNMFEHELRHMSEDDPSIEIYDTMGKICKEINVLYAEALDKSRENRTLVIWIGLDDLYEEFQTYSEDKPECLKNIVPKDTNKVNKADVFDLLDDKFNELFGNDILDSVEINDKIYDEDELDESDYEYNALEDVVNLLHAGPRYGIFNFVVYDNTYPIRNNRKIKPDDFKHKLAFSLGKDECGEYLGRNNLLDGMEQQKGIAAYYDGKGKVKKFIPYHFE